jgi:flavin-binding protein dodecin
MVNCDFHPKDRQLPMLKIIELQADSNSGWQEAADQVINVASKTVRGIRTVRVDSFEAQVAEGLIVNYRVTAKVLFELDS